VIDHSSYRWRAANWRGRPWHETVLLEAHVGAFTREGHLPCHDRQARSSGGIRITALELLPLADFAGSRNWGYDGVLWYAPDSGYGRPDELKTLIDEAHLRGLMVFLDVVYNHFGPEGNYLGRYAPTFFTDAQTPWGQCDRLPGPAGSCLRHRERAVLAARIRFDWLRLDAVHSIVELGEISMLHDLSVAVGRLAAETGRHNPLVLENDDNRVSVLDPGQDPPRGKYRAQWNDDYHHAWHVWLTGETQGYYRDYQLSPPSRHRQYLGLGLCLSGRAIRASRRATPRRAERLAFAHPPS